MPDSLFNRPGVSDQFLTEAGCVHVGENDCLKNFGFRAEGIAIPFHHANGSPIMDNDRPFARVRLYSATDSQKYHQNPGSGIHVYIPPTLAQSQKRSRLILVEGEFKSLALAEAGYAALGLCGFTGAARTIRGANGERDQSLNDELVTLLKMHQPAEVVFLGDADVVFNAQFAAEAAKLRPLLFASRQFQFVERFTVAKLPLDGVKGVDDLRAEKGAAFTNCFEAILSSSYEVPAKATSTEIFVALLKREGKAVKRLVSRQGHEGSRARIRLLQSAAQLWKEPGAPLELKPLLAAALGVSKTEVAGLVRDAANKQEDQPGKAEAKDTALGRAVGLSGVEPWPKPVNGAELLGEIRATYNRFMVLPPQADVLTAVWTLLTFLFDCFSFTPYLHVTSPEKECGKSTLAELMNHLCANATTPGGMSAASMFRRIERVKPTLLLDEWDTLSDENRQAALNVLNTGFKWNGVYTICVGDDHEDRDFHTFCPKAIFGLSEKKLPDTTRSRCFLLTLQKKLSSEHVDKLTRKFDGTILRRKCLRWANDHREKLKSAEPIMPPGLSAREEDISEPLLAVADACGSEWPDLMRQCVLHFFEAVQAEDGSIGVELLKDFRLAFDASDRLSSEAAKNYLNGLEDRPWSGWNEGKGITQRQVAAKLRTYKIQSRDIWLNGKTVKGYFREQFADAFCRYLSPAPASIREAARVPANIERNEDLSSASNASPCGLENGILTNDDAVPRGLAVEKPGDADKKLVEADLL